MDIDSFLKSPVVIDNVNILFLSYREVVIWKLVIVVKRKHLKNSHPCINLLLSLSVGRPKYNVVIPSTSNQLDTYIGKDLDDSKRGLYKLRYPVKHGVI